MRCLHRETNSALFGPVVHLTFRVWFSIQVEGVKEMRFSSPKTERADFLWHRFGPRFERCFVNAGYQYARLWLCPERRNRTCSTTSAFQPHFENLECILRFEA
jgi:hypothetical protein